jgi:serine/threonine protein phosphatase PrpC
MIEPKNFDSNYDIFKLKKFNSEKFCNTTEIMQRKIRYHDLNAQTRKSQKKVSSPYINTKNITEKNCDEKDNSETDPFLTVYGVLFSKKENNEFKYLKKKTNNIITTNSNLKRSTLWKKTDKNLSPISLPWLAKRRSHKRNIFFSDISDLSKSKGKTSILNENEMSKIKTKKIKEEDNKNINKANKKRKMIGYDMISVPGSDHGRININQDCYFVIPKVNEYEEIKIFGMFDGHGDMGDKISNEIKDYFKEYYLTLLTSNNNEQEINGQEEEKKNNLYINVINKFKNQNLNKSNNIRDKIISITPTNSQNYDFSQKSKKKKINFNHFFKEKKLNIINAKTLIKSKIKTEKINNIYQQLTSDNYSEIYSSYKKLDELLHKKYMSSKFCHLSGSTSFILFMINSKDLNKLICSNLGDSKIISISEDKKIKELNEVHTPDKIEEKNRIIKMGGVINRIDWANIGPLRIWYKDKKYPGLSITRSFGDFESDDLGVISVPDVKEYDIDDEKIKILVFGTDGVFKFLTNEKVMDIAWNYYEQNDVSAAAKKISETAIKLWNVKNPKGISDVTVFVIFFK